MIKDYIYKGVTGFNSTVGRWIAKGDKVSLDNYRADILKRSNLIEDIKTTKKTTKKED